MYSLFTNRKWRRIYLLYWAGYLLIFSVIQGVPSNDFFTAFRNELISIIPKIVFVTIVVEWLMDDLFLNKKVVRFILVYVLLLIAFAIVLRLVDNYIIIRYFLTYWKKETLLSAPPFLYNAIKLQFLVTIPFIVKLFIYQGSQKKQEKENDGAFLNLKCDRRVVKLMLADVSYFEAQGNYIFVYTAGPILKTYMSISDLEAKLPEGQFRRIHRSFIIALDKVESSTGSDVVISGKRIPIGRSYRDKAKSIMQFSD